MWSGAKVSKSCRSRLELSNENLVFACKHRLRYSREPLKVWRWFNSFVQFIPCPGSENPCPKRRMPGEKTHTPDMRISRLVVGCAGRSQQAQQLRGCWPEGEAAAQRPQKKPLRRWNLHSITFCQISKPRRHVSSLHRGYACGAKCLHMFP